MSKISYEELRGKSKEEIEELLRGIEIKREVENTIERYINENQALAAQITCLEAKNKELKKRAETLKKKAIEKQLKLRTREKHLK
ncbi:MAG: hypothetical protein AAGJ18_03675 [Bacteroidota bacterium]